MHTCIMANMQSHPKARDVQTLTDTDAQNVRDIIKLRGIKRAVLIFGVDDRTLRKAAVPEPVSRMTASLLREKLSGLGL